MIARWVCPRVLMQQKITNYFYLPPLNMHVDSLPHYYLHNTLNNVRGLYILLK